MPITTKSILLLSIPDDKAKFKTKEINQDESHNMNDRNIPNPMNALNHVIYQVLRVIPDSGFSQGIKELNVMDIYDLLHTSIKTWETFKFPYKIPGTETIIDDHCFSPTDIAKVITLKKWHKSNFSGGSTSEFFMSLSSE